MKKSKEAYKTISEAAVELGKLSEEEAEEIWRDMTGDGEEDD